MEKRQKITLILGGSRSGKSRQALLAADSYPRKAFIATALPIDEEMKVRIAAHKRERDASFVTIEEPYNLGEAIRSLPVDVDVAVVDCLTVWVGNLMYRHEDQFLNSGEMDTFFDALKHPPCPLILVSNEVGLGIIPANAQSRRFRDAAGSLNQRVAALADEVIFMVSGIPLKIKPS